MASVIEFTSDAKGYKSIFDPPLLNGGRDLIRGFICNNCKFRFIYLLSKLYVYGRNGEMLRGYLRVIIN